MNDIIDSSNYSDSIFESIKHIDEYNNEFWYAREIQEALKYKEWRNFIKVIDRAKIACENSEIPILDHFVEVNKMVEAGVASKEVGDVKLSRYACYLIVQNADARKKVVALGQTYFAVKTRQQELDDFTELSEDKRRMQLRGSIKGFNKKLAKTAQESGVKNFARFQNSGYRGLYNGENASDIKRRKGLSKNQEILDHMGATELAANYFRITQTEEKLRNDNIYGERQANQTHHLVGRRVRKTMIEISGKAPEELPTPEKSIKELEKEKLKLDSANKKKQ